VLLLRPTISDKTSWINVFHDEAGLIAEVNRLNRLRGTDDIRPFPDMHVKDCLNSNDYFERLYRGYGMQESG
jgi:hypothetical protein